MLNLPLLKLNGILLQLDLLCIWKNPHCTPKRVLQSCSKLKAFYNKVILRNKEVA